MRSIRYRRGTRRYRHSKRKERNYVFFTAMSSFGTLTRNYRIYDMDALEEVYNNSCPVLTVDNNVSEVIKSMKINPGHKIILDTLPVMIAHIHDTDGSKINVKLKITRNTNHITDFSDMEDIVDEE